MWVCACEYRCPWRPETLALGDLELQTGVSSRLWVLEAVPGSSRRVESALHQLAISLVPSVKLNHFESLFFVR